MLDEILKTVILGAPNFIGFIFAIWILNTRLTKMDALVEKLISERSLGSEQVKPATRDFSVEERLRSGTSQTEKSVGLTVANDTN